MPRASSRPSGTGIQAAPKCRAKLLAARTPAQSPARWILSGNFRAAPNLKRGNSPDIWGRCNGRGHEGRKYRERREHRGRRRRCQGEIPGHGWGEFPAYAVVNHLWNAFLKSRGLEPVVREARTGATDQAVALEAVEPGRDAIVTEMEHRGYVRIDARRRSPRGPRSHVVILVLSHSGKYVHHSPDLRGLLGGLDSEPATRGKLDEIILVVEMEFFRKKNLLEVVRGFQKAEVGGADPDGIGPIYNIFPYHVFSSDLPKQKAVPKHRVMSGAEVSAYLKRERLTVRDLFSIPADDPPVIWIGGRPGQCVEVERDSETAGRAVVVRYIGKPALTA